MTISTSLENQFLIAMPSMQDPRFVDSIALVCQHNDNGAIALLINQPSEQSLQEAFLQLQLPTEHLTKPEQRLLCGGPIQPESGFILHSEKGEWQATLAVSDTLFLTNSADILEAISKGEGPPAYFFLLGYTGWNAGQLEMELEENAWFHSPADEQILFSTPVEELIDKVMQQTGIDLSQISRCVGHA